MKLKLFFVFITYIGMHLALSAVAPQFLPQSLFPYLDDLQKSGLPHFIYSFANFDGTIYLKIAKSGYLPLTHAFFPLYPIMIAIVSFLLQPILAAISISLLSFFGVGIMFKKYIKALGISEKSSMWILAAFLLFPTSFYLLGAYTESFFLLLLISSLYAIHRKLYLLTFILTVLAALTRFVGIFLVIPVLFEILSVYGISSKSFSVASAWAKVKKNLRPILPIFGAPLGFAIYSVFLWLTTGDPIRFFNNLPDFQTGRQTDLILFPQVVYRYIKIFLTAQPNFQYFIAVIEFVIFALVFVVLANDLWKIYKKEYSNLLTRLGLNLFSFVNLLLPTFTGTFTSLPRYALTSIAFFIVLGELKNTWLKISLLITFGIFHIILFLFFIQGYFVS